MDYLKQNFLKFTSHSMKELAKGLREKADMFSQNKDGEGGLKWSRGEIHLDFYGNTRLPLKQYFFPQTETLFHVGKAEPVIKEESIENINLVFWGVRPCDLRGMELLDKVFLSGKFVDERYKAKREKAILVGFYCFDPYETCFCTSLYYDDLVYLGIADFLFFKLKDNEYLALTSTKGERKLKELNIETENADVEQINRLSQKIKEFKNKFRINFKLKKELSALNKFFDDTYFENEAFRCLGCGICTFVCPTCHCFTIEDESKKSGSCRMRCFDGCMNADFTLMAGGHNPRKTKGDRLRQRFLHKGFYFPERENIIGCVGCGRCLAKCPVSLSICEGLIYVRGEEKSGK